MLDDDLCEATNKDSAVVIIRPSASGREALARWTTRDHVARRERQIFREIKALDVPSHVRTVGLNGRSRVVAREQHVESCRHEAQRQPTSAREQVD
jgi:hypothetical protein